MHREHCPGFVVKHIELNTSRQSKNKCLEKEQITQLSYLYVVCHFLLFCIFPHSLFCMRSGFDLMFLCVDVFCSVVACHVMIFFFPFRFSFIFFYDLFPLILLFFSLFFLSFITPSAPSFSLHLWFLLHAACEVSPLLLVEEAVYKLHEVKLSSEETKRLTTEVMWVTPVCLSLFCVSSWINTEKQRGVVILDGIKTGDVL